jgi:hypothetical protein
MTQGTSSHEGGLPVPRSPTFSGDEIGNAGHLDLGKVNKAAPHSARTS